MKVGLLILSMIVLSSCSSMKDTIAAKGTGTKVTVKKDLNTVWKGLLDIIAISDLSLKSENKKDGVILAHKSMSLMSYGEHVAIFVKKINSTSTEVEIVSKRAVSTNIFAENWEKYISIELGKKFQ